MKPDYPKKLFPAQREHFVFLLEMPHPFPAEQFCSPAARPLIII
jgi:hypothetical protein